MNERTKKDLTDALAMLGMIALNGDALDIMAAAKSKIRKALKEGESDG